MKTLLVLRHAKSSWKDSSLADKDRPLNKRGKRDAPFMGNMVKEMGVNIDKFISSPAKRAHTTSKLFAEAYGLNGKKDIQIEKLIYNESYQSVMRLISKLPDKYNTVALFGHNPDITFLVNTLGNGNISNVPTCGVACIDFDVEEWNDTGEGLGNIRFFKYPRMFFGD